MSVHTLNIPFFDILKKINSLKIQIKVRKLQKNLLKLENSYMSKYNSFLNIYHSMHFNLKLISEYIFNSKIHSS